MKCLTLFSSAGLKIVFQFSSLELKESEIIISFVPFVMSPLFTCLECSVGALDPRDLGADSTGVHRNPEHVANKAKGFVFLKLESCDKSCVVLCFVGHPALPSFWKAEGEPL